MLCLAVVVLGCWAPVARLTVGTGPSLPAAAVALTAVLLVSGLLSLRASGLARVLVSATAGAGLVAIVAAAFRGGFLIPVVVTLLCTALAFGALVRWQPLPGWPQRATATCRMAVVPLIAATVMWFRVPSKPLFGIAVLLVVAALELAARAPGTAARVDRSVDRLGRVIAVGVSTLLASVSWGLFVLPTALASRVVRHDPLSSGWVSARSAWLELGPARYRVLREETLDSGRTYSRDLRRGRAARRRAAARTLLLFLPICITAVALWSSSVNLPWVGSPVTASATPSAAASGSISEEAPPEQQAEDPDASGGTFTAPFEDDPAFDNEPWARDLRLNLLDSWNNLEFSGTSGWRIRDGTSEYISVADGERRTVEPDPSLGPPVEVWFFGGSVAFGAGQRDEHTIPSELVKRAGDDGIPLRARNFGVPATVNWQSTALMIEKLNWEDETPDLIVFYDGSNDVALQELLQSRGLGTSDRQASLFDAEFDAILRTRATGDDELLATPTETPQGPPATPEQLGRASFSRYEKGVNTARAVAAEYDTMVRHFWQPQLPTKNPLTEADRATLRRVNFDVTAIERARAVSTAARAGLGSLGVTDLTTVFDGIADPIYWDAVHTNEEGARIAAAAIYEVLGAELRRLAD